MAAIFPESGVLSVNVIMTADERDGRLHEHKGDKTRRGRWRLTGPLPLTWLILIPVWISNSILYKMWDEITYPFSNFNGCTVEVWEWMNNFIELFTVHVMTYPCWDASWSMLVNGVPGNTVFRTLRAGGMPGVNYMMSNDAHDYDNVTLYCNFIVACDGRI